MLLWFGTLPIDQVDVKHTLVEKDFKNDEA